MATPKLARSWQYGRWNSDRTRVYDIEGETLPSITSIINMKDKPALVPWAANMAAEYSQKHRDALNQLEPEAAVEAIKGSWRRNRDKAATFGTLVHEAIENQTMDEATDGWVAQANAAVTDLGMVLGAQEATFVNLSLGYAGTADLIGHIPGDPEQSVVLDWKSGSGLYDSAALQLAALMYSEFMVVWQADEPVLVPIEPFDLGVAVLLRENSFKMERLHRGSPTVRMAHDAFAGLIPVWHYTTKGEVWE